jgi:hypothetical protein
MYYRNILTIVTVFGITACVHGQAKPQYNRDIRPILAENCFACHGPDSASRKAGLRLDQREAAVAAKAIIPGKPDQSLLIQRVFHTDLAEVMPPPKTHKKLTPAQKETLKRWIASGADYQPHWSFIAPTRPPLPPVKDAKWVRNPIDRFILAELEKHGLTPAPEADRRTLARRVSLDLTGLPPDPADVEVMVNDSSPDWYERYVAKMLASPHWGEHRGRFWLDAARYADTHGIHFDNYREIWTYRDWVISAFNRNLSFDQFTIEQLAGDLLSNPTLDQKIATGFNRCNITTNEGGVIAEEYLVLYARDRTETVNQVWMGLTAGCAVCHDHKFDPLTMRDFYSMAAFFNNTTQGAMDGNIPNTPPVMPVPRMEDAPKWAGITKKVETARLKIEDRKKSARGDFDKWFAAVKPEEFAKLAPTMGLRLHLPLTEGKDRTVGFSVDGKPRSVKLDSGFDWVKGGKTAAKAFALKPGPAVEVPEAGDFDKSQRFTISTWVKFTRRGTNGALVARMDNRDKYRGWDLWAQNDSVGMHLIHAWQDDALKVVTKNPLKPNEWHHVTVSYDGSMKASGIMVYVNGVAQPVNVEADSLKNTTRTNVPLKIGQRHESEKLSNAVLQDVRLFDRMLTAAEVGQLAKATRSGELLAKPKDKISPTEKNELYDWWLATSDKAFQEASAAFTAAQAEEVELRSRGTIAHVMQEKDGEAMAYILYRGEYDKRRDPVKPATPNALPPMAVDQPRNRLGFAKWLLRPEHPLTARVTVNRFWQEVFGTGIVRTTGDFGVSGELPSHPELLDWLAVEFREQGWDIKKFFTLILTSATYRQAAITMPEKNEKDQQNRLLSRGPRYRLDAELIRDHALASSGLLVRKLGGPSVKPYQPEGVWEAVAMIGSNTRDYRRDSGENLYRRSMYTFWKRSAPPASMEIFNAPNRETCAVRRDRTNTPLQALVTLNDVQFVEAARVLAEKALTAGAKTDGERIDFVAKRLISRPFRLDEMAIATRSLNELLAHYRAQPDEAKRLIAVGESKANPNLAPATLAGWTMLVNELMNLDEVLNK